MARGGMLRIHDGGYSFENNLVKELGDYNAFFATAPSDVPSMRAVANARLRVLGSEEPYNIHIINYDENTMEPEKVGNFWISEGADVTCYRLREEIPPEDVYMEWYEKKVRNYTDFDESWWSHEQQSHAIFIKHFRPIWYYLGDIPVARLYRYQSYYFTRLFSIVVEPEFRGQGYGVEMVTREVDRSNVPVYIKAGQHLEKFYMKAGFRICHKMATLVCEYETPE